MDMGIVTFDWIHGRNWRNCILMNIFERMCPFICWRLFRMLVCVRWRCVIMCLWGIFRKLLGGLWRIGILDEKLLGLINYWNEYLNLIGFNWNIILKITKCNKNLITTMTMEAQLLLFETSCLQIIVLF